jgi:diacylglycerol kinase
MRKFLKSVSHACNGINVTFKSERNFRIHLLLMLLAMGIGIYLSLSVLEWCIIIFATGFVLSAELFNTALERLGDEIATGKQSVPIKNVKDMAAGGVLISAITALIIGILILLIPFIDKIVKLL